MQVWVIGSRGMLGQAVTQAVHAAQVPYVLSDRDVDITDSRAVDSFAGDHHVTHLINCAAYTKVDACETEEAQATLVNGTGAGNVAAAAARRGAVAVHVSTDYVFDGKAQVPYAEDTPCAPLGAYGRSKWLGEQLFWQKLGHSGRARGYVVRTSWLFGRGGPNFVRTMLTLMGRHPQLRVVADQTGRPTHTRDLAQAMLRLGGVVHPAPRVAPPGTYHFANSGVVSWHGFASTILKQAQSLGISLACNDVVAIPSHEYPTPAVRPAYSVLSTEKITTVLADAPRPWHEALRVYMDAWVTQPES